MTRAAAVATLAGAAVAGGLVGVVSTTSTGEAIGTGAKGVAVAAGIARARPPQPGDHWGGCNDARAAGTAPLYRGEPGYRSGMDGDDDGIACEPVR